MKKTILPLLLLILVCGCKSAQIDFRFEKIIYHTSACFGFCPVVHLEVTADRQALLHAEKMYVKTGSGIDLSRTGYFKGTVSDSSYNKLITELRNIGLDTLKFNGPDCCDGATKTIIVYYNGKRKYLKAMFPPNHALPLIAALNDLYSTGKFERAAAEFELERDSIR
jgi:hypothetical protein